MDDEFDDVGLPDDDLTGDGEMPELEGGDDADLDLDAEEAPEPTGRPSGGARARMSPMSRESEKAPSRKASAPKAAPAKKAAAKAKAMPKGKAKVKPAKKKAAPAKAVKKKVVKKKAPMKKTGQAKSKGGKKKARRR